MTLSFEFLAFWAFGILGVWVFAFWDVNWVGFFLLGCLPSRKISWELSLSLWASRFSPQPLAPESLLVKTEQLGYFIFYNTTTTHCFSKTRRYFYSMDEEMRLPWDCLCHWASVYRCAPLKALWPLFLSLPPLPLWYSFLQEQFRDAVS